MNNDYLNPTQDEASKEDVTPKVASAEEADAVIEAPANYVPAEETPAAEAPAEAAPIAVTPSEETSENAEAFEAESAPVQEASEPESTEAPQGIPTESESYIPPAEPAVSEPVHYAQPVYTQPATPPYQAPPYQSPNTQTAQNTDVQTQYYYGTQPPAPEPPKKKKGHVAFLICLWTLIGIFAVGFFVLCGYVAGQKSSNSNNTIPTFFKESEEEPTEPSTEASSEDNDTLSGIIALPEDDGQYSADGSIELKSLPDDKSDTDKYTTQYAYKKVAESTIGVVCYESGFTGDAASQGTGIVITEDGYIATNSHVIGDSRTAYDIQVVTNDGTTYEAKVIGYDSRTDLAVLKINAQGLTPAEFCDSDLVEVGIDVIAVGNPGGLDFQNSLTRGVVSALNRELGLSAQVTYIQTDAAINPGNSGGPLSNMYGQVIGITTAKISSESVEGMGFAIPSRTVKEIVDDLMTQGYVSNRVRLGISGQAVSSTMQQYYNLPSGILIGEISEGGPCDNTDLKVNDIITKIDSEEITSFSDVYAILGEHEAGDKVVLTVYRNDTGKTFEVSITLMADEGETQQ